MGKALTLAVSSRYNAGLVVAALQELKAMDVLPAGGTYGKALGLILHGFVRSRRGKDYMETLPNPAQCVDILRELGYPINQLVDDTGRPAAIVANALAQWNLNQEDMDGMKEVDDMLAELED